MEPIRYALPDGTTTTDRPEYVVYATHVTVNGKRYERCQRAVGISRCDAVARDQRYDIWDCGSHDR